MTFLDEVYKKRKKLADVLLEEEYSGIREIVEDLYPDHAHFIYELLQNAEDANATEANFELYKDQLIFRHNGKPFSEDDVSGITNIGKGSKRDKEDEIGRFGVGFKSVFAYSETPLIWSPTYSFQISDLVLPNGIDPRPELENQTEFKFPFNNPEKEPGSAYDEIKTGLGELAETTLLFLTNLKSISWRIGEAKNGNVLRIQHPDNHIEILKKIDSKTMKPCHFLKFSEPARKLEKQNAAIAFELDFLKGVSQFDPNKKIVKQLQIKPASPGRVAVFFPAEKETSGLRFHLHAPFVPELSRASVKDTCENNPLFGQLAALAVSSLHEIRDLGLLTREVLAVLPNQSDQIPERYQCIRNAIINEMKSEPLTPIHGRNRHAPASRMLQARATFKDLLTDEDLAFFHGTEKNWVVSTTQRNNEVDRFLQQLAIKEWDTDKFLYAISMATLSDDAEKYHFDADGFRNWLSNKPIEWHQQCYAALWEPDSQGKLHLAKDKPIVRLANGEYAIGKNCFFPDDTQTDSDIMPRVDPSVYTSGKNKKQQDDARKFLEAIGVRRAGEAEQVKVILMHRYTREAEIPDGKTYIKDLRRFIALVEKQPECANLFQDYYIFECEGKQRCQPSNVYLDDPPLINTGLRVYYAPQGDNAEKFALVARYGECGISPKQISAFAEATGAQTTLMPNRVNTLHHPQSSELRADSDARWTHTAIDVDWTIPRISDALKQKSERLSLLIWQTMCAARVETLQARFRPNKQYQTREAPSSLVLQLEQAQWIPQGEGRFVRPLQASRDSLPDGFAFDPGWKWIKAINFGAQIARDSEEQRQKKAVAKELGFDDDDKLEDAQKFAKLPPHTRREILAKNPTVDLPENAPANPDRRAQRVAKDAAKAPGRQTESRERSVSVNRDIVKKEEARPYLIQQYTDKDGVMFCQICQKPLPFKRNDGDWYFECVEIMEEQELSRHHTQNYLALCPNHAAMFKHANGLSSSELKEKIINLNINVTKLEIKLAQQPRQIYFTKTHLADLRAVITAESGHDNGAGGDNE